MSGQVFLGGTSTNHQIKCLAQGHNTVTPPVVRLEIFDPQSNALPTEPLRSANFISELCYTGTILQRNYRKMTIKWSFSYNSFVKSMVEKV